ncbi:MAG: hypothetical protein WCP06_12890 [Verrucomicrobiota bacterium]
MRRFILILFAWAAGQYLTGALLAQTPTPTPAPGRTPEWRSWKKVVKTYPGSTHAHTIEFRLDSKDQLQKIFNSADQALRDFKDTALTVQ